MRFVFESRLASYHDSSAHAGGDEGDRGQSGVLIAAAGRPRALSNNLENFQASLSLYMQCLLD